jgi:carboxypeptidase Taq
MRDEEAFAELVRLAREESLLASCEALLEWDEQTQMPPGGVEQRSRQRAFLAGLLHERAADPRRGELLAALEGSPLVADPGSPQAATVRELRRRYERSRRLPRRLVEETASVASLAQQEWVAAREQAEFARFEPWLARIVALKREEAACVEVGDEAYDALLDAYEPGARSRELERLFAALGRELAPLAAALREAPRKPRTAVLRREFPVDRQRAFGEEVAAAVGFDFERGRLDLSAHPFSTSLGPGDQRITTRFDARNFCDGFFAILHEVGHALYEQALDPEWRGTPAGEAISIALHESQSRLWENRVGHSRGFWEHFFPRAKEVFPRALRGVSLDEFHLALHNVAPSLIRVDADEVTYGLHVLARFELERALVRGELRVRDLPAAWREVYRRHLGVEPANDAEGCLQDGHWAEGLFGYFPTYALGDVVAAQLFEAAEAELGDLEPQLARGEFAGLREWLRARVHRRGGTLPAARLVEAVTGRPLEPRALVETLRAKYGGLYGVAIPRAGCDAPGSSSA